MLITETSLRAIIKSELIRALNEQAKGTVRTRGEIRKGKKKAKKDVRKLKSAALGQDDLTKEEKKQIKSLHKWLNQYVRGATKQAKIDKKVGKLQLKRNDIEWDKFKNKYSNLQDKYHEVFVNVMKGKEDIDPELWQSALAALKAASSQPIHTTQKVDREPDPEEESEEDVDPTSAKNLAAVSAEAKSKLGKIGQEFDIGEKWKYKITQGDNTKIAKTGKLHFTVSSGPSNVGKTYQIKDSSHKIVGKVKELFPHLRDKIA